MDGERNQIPCCRNTSPDSGAMRLIQTSRPHDPVAPVSTAPPGEFPGWRRDAPYPDSLTAQPRSPGKRSATGSFPDSGAMRLIQTSRPHNPVAPVSAAPPGEFPGWRRDAPYPDFPPHNPVAPVSAAPPGRAAAGDRAPRISGGSAKTGVRVQNPGW